MREAVMKHNETSSSGGRVASSPVEFAEWRKEIGSVVRLRLAAADFSGVHAIGADASSRLERYTLAGKMIRGGLVCVGALFGGEVGRAAYQAGAAAELFQSALLIHDDIMDRDSMRRGEPSIHTQYATAAATVGAEDPDHIGLSLAICVGDVSFFLAFQLLSELDVPDATRSRLVSLWALELQRVGIAQMADVHRGALPHDAAEFSASTATDHALRIYLYKTGRYTFSLPLMTGAILAEKDESTVSNLDRLGEQMGVLFQLRDDELGLFGDPAKTGKPTGSDVREGKKTVYYSEMVRRIKESDAKRLSAVFGNNQASDDDVEWAHDLVDTSGAREAVNDIAAGYAQRAETTIRSLEGSDRASDLLEELLDFNLLRDR